MSQAIKSTSTRKMLILETGRPNSCEKHRFEVACDVEKSNTWHAIELPNNAVKYKCENCNLERTYKIITII